MSTETAEQIRTRYKWQKVHVPKHWRPKKVGEEIVGFYGGRTLKTGNFGQYEVMLIHVPSLGSFTLSGTMLIQLIDASMIDMGHPIRVVWGGQKQLDGDKKMKIFEVFVAEGEDRKSTRLNSS